MPAEPDEARALAFEGRAEAYDAWYEDNAHAYAAERAALAELMPEARRGLEIGVGTGRFAVPLGITHGLEPAASMARRARRRGVQVVRGVGEQLPYASDSFDTVLIVAVVAFLADPVVAIGEARRVLTPDGDLIVGLIDRGSPLWTDAYGEEERWGAAFRSAVEVTAMLAEAGFELEAARQTIFDPLAEIEAQPVTREGAGEGLFAALRARPDGQPQGGRRT